jgi:hypothetical protein
LPLSIPLWTITVSAHKPENFFIRFDYPDQRNMAIQAHSLQVGSTVYLIQPWRLEGYTRQANWYYRVKICVERLHLHVWTVEGVRQLLGDVCVFDHIESESESFTRERTEIFSFYTWMFNPDFLLRPKTDTLLSKRAGWSDVSSGPPPVAAPLPSLSAGWEVVILVHLDHYYDWLPQPNRWLSSSANGLPDSSGSSSGGHHPVFHSFCWTAGVAITRRSYARLSEPCRLL